VVTTGEELVVEDVAVVLLLFPPHPIRSIVTITRVREIPKTFFKLPPSSDVMFPMKNWDTGVNILTPFWTKSTSRNLKPVPT
jgi:hypothetical protein